MPRVLAGAILTLMTSGCQCRFTGPGAAQAPHQGEPHRADSRPASYATPLDVTSLSGPRGAGEALGGTAERDRVEARDTPLAGVGRAVEDGRLSDPDLGEPSWSTL